MPHHHPDNNILAEFAAGTLEIAPAVATKAHLHFCRQCQQTLEQLETIGGSMLENLKPEAMADDSFDHLMAIIDEQVPNPTIASKLTDRQALPDVVTTLIEQQPLKWRKINSSLKSASLTVGQKQFEVSLHNIKAGESVPEHDHRGLEITVVLEGSFSDKAGMYQAGDFIVKEPGEVHQPISAKNCDCLCLTVQESPVKLTGFLGKIINPFIRHRAA